MRNSHDNTTSSSSGGGIDGINQASCSCLQSLQTNKRARLPPEAHPGHADDDQSKGKKPRHYDDDVVNWHQQQHQQLFADVAWQQPFSVLQIARGLTNPVYDSAAHNESLKQLQVNTDRSGLLASNLLLHSACPSPVVDDPTTFESFLRSLQQASSSCLGEDASRSLSNMNVASHCQSDHVAMAAYLANMAAALKAPPMPLASSHIGLQNPTLPSLSQVQPYGIDPFTLVAAPLAAAKAAAESLQPESKLPITITSLHDPCTIETHLHSATWDQVDISASEERRKSWQLLGLAGQLIPYNDSSISNPQLRSMCLGHNNTLQRSTNTREPPKDGLATGVTVMMLACPWDRGVLTDHLIYLRKQLEFFRATTDDTKSHTRGRKKAIALLQVGIRCRHCSHIHASQRQKGSTYFPSKLMGIYQAAQNIGTEHIQSGECVHVPAEVKGILLTIKAPTKTTTSGAGKEYWAESAKFMGLIDTEEGIRFAADGANSSLLAPTATSANFFS